jgi:hypothetical protein
VPISAVLSRNVAVLNALGVDDRFYVFVGRGWAVNLGAQPFSIIEYDANFNQLRSFTSSFNVMDSYMMLYDPITDKLLLGVKLSYTSARLIMFDRANMTISASVDLPYGYLFPSILDDDYIFIRSFTLVGDTPDNRIFRATRSTITDPSKWVNLVSFNNGELSVHPFKDNLLVIDKHGIYGAKIIDVNGSLIQDISAPFQFTEQTIKGTSGSIPNTNENYICQAQMISEGVRVRCFDGTSVIDIALESYLPQRYPTTLYTEYQTLALPVRDKVVVINGWEESDARVSIYDIPSRTLLEQAILTGVTIHPTYNHTFFKGDLYIGSESSLGSGNALIKITPPNRITITAINVSGNQITVNATGGAQVLVFKRHVGASHGRLVATGSVGSPITVGSGQFKVVVR